MNVDLSALVAQVHDRGHVLYRQRPVEPVPPVGGAGTELKAMLATIGIQPKLNCKCNARAKEMDDRGLAWCEQHIEMIVDWLAEEAQRRPLLGKLFSRVLARQAVQMAIRRAREKGSL